MRRYYAYLLCTLHIAAGCSTEANSTFDAGAKGETCGDGIVGSNEECDPQAPGWRDLCSGTCTRTVYGTCPSGGCKFSSDGEEIPCGSKGEYCSPICTQDSDCPAMPGHHVVCAYAYQCTIRCSDDSECPHGMLCIDAEHCGYR